MKPSLDIGGLVAKMGLSYVKVGEFSDLWEGTFKQRQGDGSRNVKVAIKIIRGAPAHNHELHDKVTKNLVTAGNRWIGLDHPNILPFYGVVFDYSFLPAMICSYCDPGNVLEYIQDSKPTEKTILGLVHDVVKGLVYLHSSEIIHGDLRAANVLVDDLGNAVLADFGLTFIVNQSEFTTTKIAGPARWTAPEILEVPDDEEINEPPYTTKSDVFAFAMTIIEIITGLPPFQNIRNDSAVIFKILEKKRPAIPDMIRKWPDLTDAIESCWAHEASKRPEAFEVQHVLHDICEYICQQRVSSTNAQYSSTNPTSEVG